MMTILRMSNDYKFISMDVTIDRNDGLLKGHYDFSYGNADVSGTEARINELFAMYEASKNS